MATLDTKLFNIIYPDSSDSLIYEEYEYMLGWFNREGSPVQWLFCDWENQQRVRSNIFGKKDVDLIRVKPSSEDRGVKLIAEDITRDEVTLFESLFASDVVYRFCRADSELFTPEGHERLAIESGGVRWQQSEQRFRVELSVLRYELPLWR
jgi:hypothetical protein